MDATSAMKEYYNSTFTFVQALTLKQTLACRASYTNHVVEAGGAALYCAFEFVK